ncbi:hypothetical protein [Kribbella amoyensis]|uniref:hypothetical protein n=1 Tax=Kribbella amoyensis TaxID=996641 RepID=UPI001EE26B11|nr:hypothetical protein [Kribbella amoyensis]
MSGSADGDPSGSVGDAAGDEAGAVPGAGVVASLWGLSLEQAVVPTSRAALRKVTA